MTGNSNKKIGLCPICKSMLFSSDIEEKAFIGSVRKHFVYVCNNCETIIGFSSHNWMS